MIAVDTNIIAYLYLEGQHTAQAEALLAKDLHWQAPLLWRSEFRNVLSLYIRQSLISFEDALDILHGAEKQMHGGEHDVSSTQVLTLAAQSKCSAYDCEFVAVAQSLNIPLVTMDSRLISAFPKTAVSIDAFLH